jgi:hypothetical protein
MSYPSDDKIDVGGLAAVINSRLAADARIAKAIGFSWICGGAAIAACMAGLGLALAFLGYSYLNSVKPAAELTAKALVAAFESAQIKTKVSGNMSLAPDSELRLATGQAVRLSEGSIVKLDPDSSVRVVGNLKYDLPQPSKGQLQENARVGDDELPFTSYTVFKSTNYGAGQVVTGWAFELSDTSRPRFQYCYYGQNIGRGVGYKFTVARNGYARKPPATAKLPFEFDGAVANCIWFSGI